MKRPNSLINETSPYLLQHAYNPVDWHSWSEQTLAKAQAASKLLLISIGYSSCHWCHVMEKESFEDEQVARLMNEHFLCIKVDREEHPDVDQVYMQAVQLITGNGGWPLNCFALPDGRPVWGGTYFRKNQWIEILRHVAQLYQTRPDEIISYADELTRGIRHDDWFGIPLRHDTGFTHGDLDTAFSNAKCRLDWINGGPAGAPKFPMPSTLLFLLRYHYLSKNEKALGYVRLTLTRMALGGINDQLGGGFARYSTDAKWKVPHFEKMLYDNAQLISVYSEAYRIDPRESYRKVVAETIRFIRNEMTSPEGWFYSAVDADSEGEEGSYYVWTASQIMDATGRDADLAMDYFQVTAEGNWENGRNILFRVAEDDEVSAGWNMTVEEFNQRIDSIKDRLFRKRNERPRPRTDDKLITSWNALMIRAYVDAYLAFRDSAFLIAAQQAMDFILARLKNEKGGLWRTYKAGQSKIEGFLDDHAAVADALLALYQVTFEEKWLDEAIGIVEFVISHFSDKDSGLFFYTSDRDQQLIARKFEWIDTVMPSSNAMMAHNLFTLGHILDNSSYINQSMRMADRLKEHLLRHSMSFANWGLLVLELIAPFKVIAISGKDANHKLQELLTQYYPWKIVVGAAVPSHLMHLQNRWTEEETRIFVCSGDKCYPPVIEVTEMLSYLK